MKKMYHAFRNWYHRQRIKLIRLLGGFEEGALPEPKENVSIKGVFNYGEVTEGQKSAVEEVLVRLKQDPKISFVLDDETINFLKKEFKIVEIPKYDLSKSPFYNYATKKNYYIPVQGWIKEGQGKDAVDYPILATNMDIRQYDEMMKELIEMGKKDGKNL